MKNIFLLFTIFWGAITFGQKKGIDKTPPPPSPIYPKVENFKKRNASNEIFSYNEVHRLAYYPKGSEDIKRNVIKQIDFSKWADLGTIIFKMKFFVERDGSVSKVEVESEGKFLHKIDEKQVAALNLEVKHILENLKLTFSPAMINETAVRSFTSSKMYIDFYD